MKRNVFVLSVLLGGFSLAAVGCSTKPALPWCAATNDRNDCDFVSFEQCQATVRGLGGVCVQNPGPIGRERERRMRGR
jgi:hypothetical protein